MVFGENLRYWALVAYTAVVTTCIVKGIINTPETVAVAVAPIAAVIAADQLKHRAD